jgi:hypothetical protein
LSERAVFALVPVVTLSTFLATPALLVIWLHKPEFFNLDVCILMTLISAAAGIKEHKYQFQISINHHAEMARFLFFTYVGMVACMIPFVHWFGIRGFLVLWLVTETAQILYTVKLNQKLFSHFSTLEMEPLAKLGGIIVVGMIACEQIAVHMDSQSVVIQLAITLLFAVVLLAIEYPVFSLGGVRDIVAERFGGSRPPGQELTPAA